MEPEQETTMPERDYIAAKLSYFAFEEDLGCITDEQRHLRQAFQARLDVLDAESNSQEGN